MIERLFEVSGWPKIPMATPQTLRGLYPPSAGAEGMVKFGPNLGQGGAHGEKGHRHIPGGGCHVGRSSRPCRNRWTDRIRGRIRVTDPLELSAPCHLQRYRGLRFG
jgi:hypothetical protein